MGKGVAAAHSDALGVEALGGAIEARGLVDIDRFISCTDQIGLPLLNELRLVVAASDLRQNYL